MTRLPAVPLITADPYFSVWVPADRFTQTDTAHWCGKKLPVYGTVAVDGKEFRFLGTGEKTELPMTDLTVTPCTTKAVFENELLSLTAAFTMPFLPNDLDRVSTPICLIKMRASAKDGKTHEIKAKLAFSDHFTYMGDTKPEIGAYPMPYADLNMMSIGQKNQKILSSSGDSVTIDWGYLFLGAKDALLSYDGECLNLEMTVNGSFADFRALAGYDDVASILYYGLPCRAWYARNGKNFVCAMRETYAEFDGLIEKCAELDKEIAAESVRLGGEDYAYITAAAWRHVFAAHKLIADGKGNMVFLSKENNSNGCIGTVDVSYPSTPLFLKFCPELVNALCRPVLEFAHMDVWAENDFAPHDVGRYPIVNGQVYGNDGSMDVGGKSQHQPPFYLMPAQPPRYKFRSQMPVEESGNMLVMMYAAVFFGADKKLVLSNLDLCDKWVNYLIKYGEDPGEQLCTDDFAGHLNHNINLSAKAIMGVASYAKILELAGRDGSAFMDKAVEMAKSWLERAYSPEGTYLTFDKKGWSMKYNLAWDKVLGFNLFDDKFYDFETRSYLKRINEYGLPLDNRSAYTKSDWQIWCAAMAPDREVRMAIIKPMAKYLRETESRVAFSDWYYTDSGKYVAFIARSVQGGLFMPFLYK